MIKRELGNTGLQVSVLGFGSMEIGRLRYEEAEKLLNEALDGGINFVDSSPCYGIAEGVCGQSDRTAGEMNIFLLPNVAVM